MLHLAVIFLLLPSLVHNYAIKIRGNVEIGDQAGKILQNVLGEIMNRVGVNGMDGGVNQDGSVYKLFAPGNQDNPYPQRNEKPESYGESYSPNNHHWPQNINVRTDLLKEVLRDE